MFRPSSKKLPLKEKGIQYEDRLFLSDRAHIDFDLHHAVDGLEEVELGKASIDTTRKGIGPTFSSRAARFGIILADVFNPEVFESRLRRLAEGYQKRFGVILKYDLEDELKRFREYAEQLRPFVVDEIPLLNSVKSSGAPVIVEGAQALMLDIGYGTYPYGYTAINLTKLDILDNFEELHVGIAYLFQGVKLASFPASMSILENVEVQY